MCLTPVVWLKGLRAEFLIKPNTIDLVMLEANLFHFILMEIAFAVQLEVGMRYGKSLFKALMERVHFRCLTCPASLPEKQVFAMPTFVLFGRYPF